jgi:pimeloyl-ACP methyl ester carboxylesterase
VAPVIARKLAFSLFFNPFRFKEPERHRQFRETAEHFEAIIDNKKVQYYKWGTDGPPVIFVHGWSGRASQFHKFVPAFVNAGYQAFAFDGPAHGLSEGKSTDLLQFNKAIEYLLTITGPAHFIGHSFGGVAGVYAMSNGIKLHSIITIGSPTVSDYIVQEFCRRINASEQSGVHFNRYIERRYGRPFKSASIIEMTSNLDPMPFLMIHDEEDSEVPIRHAEENITRNPWVLLSRTQGLGHYKVLTSPKVLELCLNFITDHT